MKQWIFLLFPIIMVSCQRQEDPLVGKWKVNSKFYSATYQISEAGNELNGLVLSYNDGTSKYKQGDEKQYFVFTGLKKESELQYVDGISGATSKKDAPKSIEIKQINKDTLEVTTFIMNKPLTEIWTRK